MTRAGSVTLLLVLGACSRAERAPGPMAYRWPEDLSYGIEYIAETRAGEQSLHRYGEVKLLRITLRGDDRVAWYDSVLKTTQQPGGPIQLVDYMPEDTLQFFLELGQLGELGWSRPGCDPAIPACREALTSSIRLEMRRFVPRLSVWPVPRGGTWIDTLAFDDARSPRGARGHFVTEYRSDADTVIAGRTYWMISWRARRTAFRQPGPGEVLAPDVVRDEEGQTFVDKQLLLPVFAIWSGAVPAPPALRSLGATGTGYRGRAWLMGSAIDSIINSPGALR